MKLGPLPPKPSRFPPGTLWMLSLLLVGFTSLALSLVAADGYAADGDSLMLLAHCMLAALMVCCFAYDIRHLLRRWREWRVLRRQWEALHAMREHNEKLSRGNTDDDR